MWEETTQGCGKFQEVGITGSRLGGWLPQTSSISRVSAVVMIGDQSIATGLSFGCSCVVSNSCCLKVNLSFPFLCPSDVFLKSDLGSQPWRLFFSFLFFLSLLRYQFYIFFLWYLPNHLFYVPVAAVLARSLLLHTHKWNAAWVILWLWVSPFSRLTLNLDFIMSHLVTCPLKFRYFYSRSLAYGLIPYWVYIIILTRGLLWENQSMH